MTNQKNLHPILRGSVLLAVLLVTSGFAGAVLAQDTCEIPLFVKQNVNRANVMILADNSGSMNAAVYHDAYDPNITYAGNFNSGSTYYIGSTNSYTPRSFSNTWPSSPSATLVRSDNASGRYIGNYLNWIYFNNGATSDTQRATLPQYTRIQLLKMVLDIIIDRSSRLDFGLAKFNYNNGGKIVAECGEDHAVVKSRMWDLEADSWTPLGETMEDILDYYSGADSPIAVPCQYNFNLVVTDGLPTMDRGVSSYLHDADNDGNDPGSCASIGAPYSESNECSDHFDDVAYYMAHEDLRSDLEDDQTVTSYVVGFNEHAPILYDAAINGNGLYFNANNAIELYLSIEYALQDIMRRISAGSAVAVVSTERGTDDRLYRGKFMPDDWHGYLECYELPYENGDQALWEAGEILRTTSTNARNIFTAIDSDTYDFTSTYASELRGEMGVSTEAFASNLINWTRGNYVSGLRDRKGWLLGDIVHSTPVVVGPPTNFQATEAYQNFYNANVNRKKLVYVGGNDAMLHAFDAEHGYEEWAFVPQFALGELTALADSGYCHRYTCDQTVTVKDIMVDGSWRTILASGGGRGSSAFYCLDITYPEYPQVMWQESLPDGWEHTSEVEIVEVDGTAMALIGSGFHNDGGESRLYAYRVSDGQDLGYFDWNRSVPRNKATKPAMVDSDLDGDIDLMYVAEMSGDILRIDTHDSESLGNWTSTTLIETGLEITANPVVAFGENGENYVYVGTGAYLEDADVTTIDQQKFLCVVDRHDEATYDLGDLANQTTSITDDVSHYGGWYVNLWKKPEGERVTQNAAVVAGTVIFTSFAPSEDPCVAGGTSWLYQMAYDNGGMAENEESEDPEDRGTSLGDGIASYPVVDLASGKVVVQSSDASISVEDIAATYMRLTVRSWAENYDGAKSDQTAMEGGDPQQQ
ncbi:MAG: hypothetical protein GY838_13765 [bacterium]|nr:hypothetical protein [bacterium]